MKQDKISFTLDQLEEVKDDPYKLQELLQNVNYSTYNGETKVLLFAFMYAGNMLERLQEREFKLSPDEQVKLERLYADIITNVYFAIDIYKFSDILCSLNFEQYGQRALPMQKITDPLVKAICTYKRAKMPVSFTMEQLEEVKDDYRGLFFLLQHVDYSTYNKKTRSGEIEFGETEPLLMALLYAYEMCKKIEKAELPQIKALLPKAKKRLESQFFDIVTNLTNTVHEQQVLEIIDDIDPHQLAQIMCGKGDRVLKGTSVTIDAICCVIYWFHHKGYEGCHETDLNTLNGRMLRKEEAARQFLPKEPMYQEYVFRCQCGRYALREGFFVDGEAHTTECGGHCKR